MEKVKILIIEDESSILDILTYALKKEGYEVRGAEEGNKGLDSDIIDKILGLELGADDYIPKPFDVREVLARVRAVLRRVKVSTGFTPGDTVHINEHVKLVKSSRTEDKEDSIIIYQSNEINRFTLSSN